VAAGVPARLAGCSGIHAHRCAEHGVLLHVNRRLWEVFSSFLWLLGMRTWNERNVIGTKLGS
jgi:hypothetical protein